MKKMDRLGNINYEPTREEDLEDHERLRNEKNNLEGTIVSKIIRLVISWGAIALIGYITKVNFAPAFDIVKLCMMGGTITAIKYGGEAIMNYQELKKVNYELEGIEKHLTELSKRENEPPERVMTEREYKELKAKKDGYVPGVDPRVDKIFNDMLDQEEKEQEAKLEKTRIANGIKPVSDSIKDEAIPEMNDDLEPPEFMNNRRGR